MKKFACLSLVVCMSGWIACTQGGPEGLEPSEDDSDNAGTGGEQNDTGGAGGQDQGEPAEGGQAGQEPASPGGEGGHAVGGAGSGGTAGAAGSGGTAGAAMGGGAGTSSMGGGGGGAPGTPCAQLAHCDSFESYTTGSRPGGPWTGFEVGGTLAVDETRGFGGSKKSVKIIATPGGGMTSRMRHSGAGVLPADEIYLRMMVWMDAVPKGEGHWNWLWGEGNASQQSGGKLNNAFVASGGSLASGRTWMLYGGGAAGGYQDCFAHAQTRFPLGRWVCYEFYLSSKTNTGHAWVDGRLDELLSFDDAQPLSGQCLPGHNFTGGKWFVPRIEKVFFGWKMYHTLDSAATAWIDDAAISTKRIGCPAN